MTDSDSSSPPAPPPDSSNKPAAPPRRIVKTEADHPANAEPQGRDRPSVSQRVFEQRPDQRTPPAPSPSTRPARAAKPDLRDLPPPRRDTPANVWRADPPPAPPRRRDDFARDDRPRNDARRPDDDRREGPRRAWGDAPRADRPGERRTGPAPGRDNVPSQARGDGPSQPRGDAPPDVRRDGPANDAPRPAFRKDDRRATGFPPGPPRERAWDDRRPPPGRDDPRGPQAGGYRDDRGGPPGGGYRDNRDDRGAPAGGGVRDDRGAPPRGHDNSPRYAGPRDDHRGAQGGYGDDRSRGAYGDRAPQDRPHYPSGPNERPRPQGHRADDRRHKDNYNGPRDDGRQPQGERPRPAPPKPAPRPPANPDEPRREDQRLSKVLAERGIASRREADDWIDAGWVKVDGEMAVLGARVFPHQVIEIDPMAKVQQAHRITILLNKPIGYVSGQAEDGYEPASVLVTQANHWPEDPSREHWHPGHARGIAPAGRLDIDSTGLLVLTQDGRVARHLIGEDSDVEKEYLVRVEYPSGGQFPDNDLERLRHGLWLDGKELKPAKVSWANEDQLRFVLREGRKRQIRRMCEAVGLVVTGLRRVRIGSVVLGKLPVGQWRYLREDERF